MSRPTTQEVMEAFEVMGTATTKEVCDLLGATSRGDRRKGHASVYYLKRKGALRDVGPGCEGNNSRRYEFVRRVAPDRKQHPGGWENPVRPDDVPETPLPGPFQSAMLDVVDALDDVSALVKKVMNDFGDPASKEELAKLRKIMEIARS